MNAPDFLLSIIASLIANSIGNTANNDDEKKLTEDIENKLNNTLIQGSKEETNNNLEMKFISFEQDKVWEYIKLVEEPVIHIIFELHASTYYNLPAIVLECFKSEQWYIFRRGRIAAQGSGGGSSNFRSYLNHFKSENVRCYFWVMENEHLDNLEKGLKLWTEISHYKIPLLASKLDYFYALINEINQSYHS